MRRIALSLTALTLAGCLSTSPSAWTQAPDEERQTKQDIFECKAYANQVSWQHTAYGGAVMPLIGLGARRSAFKECMASRGYQPQ